MTQAAPAIQSLSRAERASRAASRAVEILAARQTDDHWPSDYGGPLFLMPGLLIACEITGTDLGGKKRRMLEYLHNVQNADGGYGLHVEGPSTVLGTALNYVALRILGEPKDGPAASRCRERLLALGGAEGIPTWGKFWLAVFGLYRWEGTNPFPPELWLLPRSLPMHPANLWCHTRAVFLPMSYLYGRRFTAAETPLIRALRSEIFTTPWDRIDWPSLRNRVAPCDVYTPHSLYLDAFNELCTRYERRPSRWLREKALAHAIDLIHHEDETTAYLTIGPVSKAIHLLATWVEDPGSRAVERHRARIADYLWDGHDGLKMQGYNGSQLWDVAFAMRALLELRAAGDARTIDPILAAAHRFLDRNQVRENIDRHERYHRDPIRGGWPFSTAEQGWTVSDCTAEGLKVALEMQSLAERPIAQPRLEDAADLLLFSQNEDGGWSEYERARGGKSLERLNAAEVFGDIMIGYSYTECTSACIQSLRALQGRWPDHRKREIDAAVERGARFIEGRQRDDGGFYGGWGVCFTYGTWFAIEGLLAAGRSPTGAPVRRAVRFLLDHQRSDGAFGEAFESCVEHRWVQAPRGQVVQTSWALLALMAAPLDDERRRAVVRGIDFLIGEQRSDGGWDRQPATGVFNRNCAINYDNYRLYFPLWAIARYLAAVERR